MSKKLLRIVSLLTLTLLLLTGCISGLSDEQIMTIIQEHALDGETKNWEILSKGKCSEISPTAKARGITEAWIVEYIYDWYNDWYEEWVTRDWEIVIVKDDGQWQKYQLCCSCP